VAGVDLRKGGHRIVFLGPPSSGKGTQAVRLAQKLGIPAISTGDMLRAAVASGSPLGARVKDVLAGGRLVNDELMADVIRERLAAADAAAGFLLDGYPRTVPQVETLQQILDRSMARTSFALVMLGLAAAVATALGAVAVALVFASDAEDNPWLTASFAVTAGLLFAYSGLVAMWRRPENTTGRLLAVVGYKVFDKCTPGDLNKEILENRNVAAAIVAAAVILGICLIVAAAMLG